MLDSDLKEKYPFLDKDGANPRVKAFLHDEVSSLPEFIYKHPAMIVCPGGGYQALSRREAEPIALEFLRLGFNVFILYYSVRPHPHVFPQAIRELAATVDLIDANTEEWDLVKGKIAVTGYSAGGHLAASYCTLRNSPEVLEVIDPKPVQAAVLAYPVITADPQKTNVPTIKNISASSEITPEITQKYSLEKYVSAELTPPTFIWHTVKDEQVPVENSLLYAGACANAGVEFELHIFPNGRHGLSNCNRLSNYDFNEEFVTTARQWVGLCEVWLKKYFDI